MLWWALNVLNKNENDFDRALMDAGFKMTFERIPHGYIRHYTKNQSTWNIEVTREEGEIA
jgi:hypothetical protein